MTGTDGAGATIRAALVGSRGFERATVWGAVGFALAYVAFEFVPSGPVSTTGADASAWYAAGIVATVAVGAVALARDDTGALPCTVLVYGPAAAVLLRTTDPIYTDLVPAAVVVEPLLVAVAVAVAVGFASYLIGRLIAPSTADGGGREEIDRESDGTGGASGADTGDD